MEYTNTNTIQSTLLLYLDDRRFLLEMKIQCHRFLEQLTEKNVCKFVPLRFQLVIDIMDLLDAFPLLGDFLLREPLKLQTMCNEILYSCLQAINEDAKKIEYSQVAVNINLKSVPMSQTVTYNYRGLVCFEGLLIAISKAESYVYHSVWSCPEECEGNEVILHYIPKVPPKCFVCRSILFENSGLRYCGERVKATLKPRTGILSKTFFLVDDLIPKLKLGSKYVLHSIAVKKVTNVWSLEEVLPLAAPMTSPIPKDVKELYEACKGVPWKFVYCLASSIGVKVCPLNCFMHLKISLLLSLTSIKANMVSDSSILHVLVAGYDTRYVGELMVEAAKLGDRCVCLGTSDTVVSSALIASSGGVCVMPLPLHIYGQKQTSAVLSAIETGDVNSETTKAKLKTAIWAQGMDFKKVILFNVASVFGNICRGDYGEYHDEIVEFDLQMAVEPAKTTIEEIKALKDVAVYLDYVAGMKIVLEDRAESLLRNYFLAARKEKPRGVSVGSMAALVANCLTSARLCLRNVANIDDAVFAIWLHVSGCPEPRFAPEEYLQTPADIKQIDKMMNNFKDWLEQFISNYIY